MSSKVPVEITYLTKTLVLLTVLMTPTVTSAGIRGLGPGARIGDTITRSFVYNPPTHRGPPSDVMALLANGKTSGIINTFGTRHTARQESHAFRTTPITTYVNFPAGHPPVDQGLTQNINLLNDLQDVDYDYTLTWNPTKSVSEERHGDPPTSSSSGIPDNKEVTSPPITEFSTDRFMETLSDSQAFLVSTSSTDKLSTISHEDNDYKEIPTTDSFFKSLADTTEHSTAYFGSTDILNSIVNTGTKFPDSETLIPTDIPVEYMTKDDFDDVTTLTSINVESHNEDLDQKSNFESTTNPEMIQFGKKSTDNLDKEESPVSKVSEGNEKDVTTEISKENLKEESEENVLGRPTNSEQDLKTDSSGGEWNSILFTIDETETKDGHIRVKIGKALDYNANLNSISKDDDVYQYHFQDPDTGWYKFGYGDNNQWRHEERLGDGVILGRYGWQDAYGKEHMTHFVADAKGYRVVQPGQKITMHVAAPSSTTLNPPIEQINIQSPSVITTAEPQFTRKPTIPPSSATTGSFPITSVSTTLTLSTSQSANDHHLQSSLYPGSIDELIRPSHGQSSVVTGRPPIAYPLPHQSVSHRPGSWVYVSPPTVQGTNRPYVRPAYRPFRPYPNRPIKNPFRPVNRPRPKPHRPRPLKPLRQKINKDKKPQQDNSQEEESSSESTSDKPVNNPNDNKDGVVRPTVDKNFVKLLQAFLSNPSKYPIEQQTQGPTKEPPTPESAPLPSIPNYVKPTEKPSIPEVNSKPEPIMTDNTSNLSPGELMHFVNLINSLKVLGQESVNPDMKPSSTMLHFSSNNLNSPELQSTKPSDEPSIPSVNLKPPPILYIPLSSQDFSSSYLDQVTHSDDHHPLDYAFMEEDYSSESSKPISLGETTEPTSDQMVANGLSGSITMRIPGAVPVKLFASQSTSSTLPTNSNTVRNTDSDASKITTVSMAESNTITKPLIKDTTKKASSSTQSSPISEIGIDELEVTTDEIWPYGSTQSESSPASSIGTTTRSPPPPPHNIWTDILNTLYYWPKSGPTQKTATIQ